MLGIESLDRLTIYQFLDNRASAMEGMIPCYDPLRPDPETSQQTVLKGGGHAALYSLC
jgi:hypothetical protein